MNYSYNDLKKKVVVNVADGKKLGHVSDLMFSFPKCCVESITVANCRMSALATETLTLGICAIDKIGEDVILVRLAPAPPETPCSSEVNSEE